MASVRCRNTVICVLNKTTLLGAYCLLSCCIYMLLLCHTTDKQRDKQNNGQTDGHTPEMTDRQTDRMTNKQADEMTDKQPKEMSNGP